MSIRDVKARHNPLPGSRVVFPQGDMIQTEPCEKLWEFIGISPFGKTTRLPGG